MTREEAIEQLEWYFEEDNGISADLVTKQAFNTIKKALLQEPCDNAISREAVIEDVMKCTDMNEDTLDVLIEKTEKLPSVTPKQKSGKWITDEPTVLEPYVCSECGIFHNGKYKNFCPNCGAKMESEDNG